MHTSQRIGASALVLASATILAQAALASGEPKNQPPFTRPAATRTIQATHHSVTTSPVTQGEPKNEWPFTRPVVTRSSQEAAVIPSSNAARLQGEPKNQPPFTDRATVVVREDGGGFNWGDSGIGLVAGVGITLSGAALLFTRRSPRTV
jgi:hypothetical protein